jgi:hypothetical protein
MFERYSNVSFLQNPTCGSRVVPYGRTDGRTDMTKVIVISFCNFPNAPKTADTPVVCFRKTLHSDRLQRCDAVQSDRILSMLRRASFHRPPPPPSRLYICSALKMKSAGSCELLVYLYQTTARWTNLAVKVVRTSCTSHVITTFILGSDK